jgi:hypothetical protein
LRNWESHLFALELYCNREQNDDRKRDQTEANEIQEKSNKKKINNEMTRKVESKVLIAMDQIIQRFHKQAANGSRDRCAQ